MPRHARNHALALSESRDARLCVQSIVALDRALNVDLSLNSLTKGVSVCSCTSILQDTYLSWNSWQHFLYCRATSAPERCVELLYVDQVADCPWQSTNSGRYGCNSEQSNSNIVVERVDHDVNCALVGWEIARYMGNARRRLTKSEEVR